MRRHLTAVLALAAVSLATPAPPRADEPRVVEITARRFQYTPSEVKLEKGVPVVLRVHSDDVTHGFFQRALGIDAEIFPGKVTDVSVTPREAGRYTVICHHFCGAGHGNMKMTVVVE